MHRPEAARVFLKSKSKKFFSSRIGFFAVVVVVSRTGKLTFSVFLVFRVRDFFFVEKEEKLLFASRERERERERVVGARCFARRYEQKETHTHTQIYIYRERKKEKHGAPTATVG